MAWNGAVVDLDRRRKGQHHADPTAASTSLNVYSSTPTADPESTSTLEDRFNAGIASSGFFDGESKACIFTSALLLVKLASPGPMLPTEFPDR
jgi:hypothetical protein